MCKYPFLSGEFVLANRFSSYLIEFYRRKLILRRIWALCNCIFSLVIDTVDSLHLQTNERKPCVLQFVVASFHCPHLYLKGTVWRQKLKHREAMDETNQLKCRKL